LVNNPKKEGYHRSACIRKFNVQILVGTTRGGTKVMWKMWVKVGLVTSRWVPHPRKLKKKNNPQKKTPIVRRRSLGGKGLERRLEAGLAEWVIIGSPANNERGENWNCYT